MSTDVTCKSRESSHTSHSDRSDSHTCYIIIDLNLNSANSLVFLADSGNPFHSLINGTIIVTRCSFRVEINGRNLLQDDGDGSGQNQERPSVNTKEVITVNTSLDLDTFSKLLPFLRCYFVNSPVNEENKLNVEDQGSMEKKILMVISICSTFLIAVALVCTGILIYIWKRVFNVGLGSSTAVQFSIQSNAVVCTSNAAEEIEIVNSTEENHVYDSVIYTGYQTFQPKTSDDLTETINSNATSISDLSIQPETSESLTESIPTSIADQTFQPKTSESQTATISRTSTCVADQTLNDSKCPTETDPVYINMACQTTVNERNK
ncbi:uncharacterized protein LOC129921953 [Biomphalaria glabrata]|uniref:Uncharacterized protein LOC129921953 n=1 Tax=Biomphalaria glabrata TaxID=6526 RepID=A0A9W2YF85_BIOGL|nr:uncharacterized protein LOC129921953 [Biomphalaria glabrata]